MDDAIVWLALALLGLVALIGLFIAPRLLNLWIQARFAGAPVTFSELLAMRLRGVDVKAVVYSRIRLHKGDIHDVTISDLEKHQLSGGDVSHCTGALIVARRTGAPLTWRTACALDLAGRDPLKAAEMKLDPNTQFSDVPRRPRDRT